LPVRFCLSFLTVLRLTQSFFGHKQSWPQFPFQQAALLFFFFFSPKKTLVSFLFSDANSSIDSSSLKFRQQSFSSSPTYNNADGASGIHFISVAPFHLSVFPLRGLPGPPPRSVFRSAFLRRNISTSATLLLPPCPTPLGIDLEPFSEQ